MWQAIAIYFILGAILSVILGITSKHPLPLGREIRAHLSIMILWPVVLVHIIRLTHSISNGTANSKSDDDLE